MSIKHGDKKCKEEIPQGPKFTQMFLELNSTGGEAVIKNLKPITQDWGKKIEEIQHLTSAGASAVPRAAQQALC